MMSALAREVLAPHKDSKRGFDRTPARPAHVANSPHPTPSFTIQRKAQCACGGGCPGCREEQALQPKLEVSQAGDALEQEADRVAERVMSRSAASPALAAGTREATGPRVARAGGGAASHAHDAPALVHDVLRSTSQPLDVGTRMFMESQFDHSFAHVRVHTGREAAESAHQVAARAFTVGDHIVFGAGEYQPSSSEGRRLLAHELTHVVQQTSGATRASAANVIQRVPTISILDENFVGPAAAGERRAAKSCPIDCCGNNLGTLHAMPLFLHQSRGAIVQPGSPLLSTGVGAELHFIAGGSQPPAGDLCHCDSFRMIQILESNDPQDPRGNNSFVDNNNQPSPFYGDVYRSGHDEHPIPAGYVDAGERVETTESIYDRPYRTDAMLTGSRLTTDFNWMAETCVSCIKNNEADRILGCVTYGFNRRLDARTGTFGPAIPVSPGCLARPTAHFIDTLSADPSTTGYDFRAAPGFIECNPDFFEGQPGDFPTPRGDTRIA
jgi:hypothetical protein